MVRSERSSKAPSFQNKTNIKPKLEHEASIAALPTELRLKIYSYLFTHTLIHISARNRLSHPPNPLPSVPRLIFIPSTLPLPTANPHEQYIHCLRSPEIGILSTCRLFRTEALPVCYETATFQVNGNAEVGLEWLGNLSVRGKKSLRELRLRTSCVVVSEKKKPSLFKVIQDQQRCLQTFEQDRRFTGVGSGVLRRVVGKY